MDRGDIKKQEEESKIGNWVLAINFSVVLILMIYQLFKSFNSEPVGEWHFYYSIIGYSWGLIFVSIFLYFTIRNLIK